MEYYIYNGELYHHGVKGMRWGVRRTKTQLGGSRLRKKQSAASEGVHDDYKRAHSGKKVKSMSDSELRSANNRLQMERQYKDLTRKTSKGTAMVSALIKTAGTIAAAETAYKTYERVGKKAIEAIGDWVMADLARGLAKGL